MKRYKKIYIEITDVCNLSCSFCPKTTRAPRFMESDELDFILDRIDGLTDYIYFHLMGEPLLHPQLRQMLDIAHKHGKKVIITTNGTLIDSKSDDLLSAQALHKIVFSLHSFEANSSELSMVDYLNSITDFCKKASAKGVITNLRLWNESTESITGKNLLNRSIFDIIGKAFDYDSIYQEVSTAKRGIKLIDNVYIGTANCFEWPDMKREKISQQAFCYGLRDHFAIQCDGTVVPCCLDNNGEIALGNIFTQNIEDILNSKRAENIYDGFSSRHATEELCSRCEFVTRFSK